MYNYYEITTEYVIVNTIYSNIFILTEHYIMYVDILI